MKIFNLTYSFLFYFSVIAYGQSTTITGNVYDGTTGAPLSNYTITSSLGGSATTNTSGFYTLVVASTSDFHVILAAQNGKCYREKWTWGRKILDFHLTACNYDRNRDSIALRSLYDNLSGAAWTNPWNTAQPITSWGLGYNTRGGGPVEFVGLDNRNLNGTFPTSTTGFSNLRDLFGFQFVGNTNLIGSLPSLSNMKQLDWVKIQESGMSGDPLSSIAGLKNIEFLRLTFNTSMTTTFPSTISTDWRNVYNLQLESVNLSGTIPTALFALPNLQTVGLGQNKLTGTVPSLTSGSSSTIKYLILNDNDLDSLPDLSVSPNLTALGIKGNKLTFDDIVPNMSKFNAATVYEGSANSFVYTPQDSFFVDTTIRASENTPLSIDVKIDGALTSNVYTWKKNGVFFRTTTTNKLTFTSLLTTDAGIYTCTVTNTNAPLLTLQSRSITLNISTACRSRDSLALVDLYNTTDGANWTNKWILTQPMTTWFGITLSTSGCVERIELNNQNLVGTINTSLDNMVNLQWLYLNNNRLSGSIPNFTLPNLQFFVLAGNQLTGTMPNFNLPSLKMLDHGNNQLSGTVPNLNLPNLFYFNLSDNRLSGTIPNFNLPSLQHLILPNNQLSGAIPNFNLPVLTALDLGINQLTGTLPNLSLPQLTYLSIGQNQLSGVIPNLALPNLVTLYLDRNQFVGTLPNFNLPKLETLLCYQNKIDSCPKLTNLPSLQKTVNVWKGLANHINKLSFDDIIPNIGFTTIASYIYNPQDSFFVDTTIIANTGTSLSISLKIDGAVTTNSYKWFKNGVLQSAYTSSSNKLIINNLQATDAGVWTCQVTNPAAPLLTLYSRKITIQLNQSCHTRDSLALVDLYNAAGGANWTSPWNLNQPMTTWLGIRLNASGCVDNIDLSNRNLIGTINASLNNMVELQTISININQLSGNIPNFNVPNLQRLELGNNRLNGNIPNLNLPNLQYLSLSSNQLNGTIPNFNLPNLLYLALSENQLSGGIPNFNLLNLEYLNLSINPLGGTVPNFSFPNLEVLFLGRNQLIGGIPNFNFPSLRTFHLADNQLSGNIPNFNFPNLRTFDVFNNQLNGNIPNFNSPSLGRLDCSNNQLSGTIPNFNMPILNQLTLNNNQLIGTIPNFNLPELINLKLQSNQLSGTIPNFNLPKLQSLILSQNKLDSCSRLTNLPALKPVNGLKIDANDLLFDDIIPNMGFATSASFTYNPQDSFFVDTTIIGNTGTPLSIDLKIDGALTTNSYKWFKNGVLQSAYTSNSNKLTINSLQATDAGVWTCQVTNPAAPLLTLYSRKITIQVGCAAAATGTPVTKTVCTGQTYTSPSGRIFSIAGTYNDTLKNINNCDSVVYTLNLAIAPNATNQTLTPSVCTTFRSPSGKILSISGVYQDTVKTINGCDSIRYTINLTIQNTAIRQTLNPLICPTQTYRSPSGKIFSTIGVKLDTLKNQSGCDSILFSINLRILTPQYQQATPQSICKGDVYRGKILTRDTAFIDTLRSIGLCDSVITTTPVKVNNASVNNLNLSLCIGSSVTVNGIVYNATNRSGQQILPAASATGCDSIINISTTFVSNLSAIDDDYTISDSTNTLTFNVLVNDVYSGSVKTTPLSKPATGQLDTLGIGRFRFSFPPQTNGITGFNYRLCSVGCPNVCDTATVKITINRPRLLGDVSLGITPNCICPNDRLIFSELELNPDKFPNNELVIISRWGDVVYQAKPYKNDWTGANEKGEVLPAGTYYYIMRLDLANSKIKTGDVTIYR